MAELSGQAGDFDHTDPAIGERIYEWIAERRPTCPVARGSKFGGFWAVFGYSDVTAALSDTNRFSSAAGIDLPHLGTNVKSYPLEADPPEHGQYRRLIQPYFTRGAVARYAPMIRDLVAEHLAEIAPRGRAEVVSEIAQPVPSGIIALILGVDQSRWRDLHQWANGMLEASIAGDPAGAQAFGRKLFEFLAAELEERKLVPRDDLLTAITQARIGGREVPDELRWGMAQVLMIAGHETTVNAAGSLIRRLATRPRLRDEVAADPAMRARVIEESLRFDPPVFGLARTVTEATEMSGTAFAAGDRVLVCFGAANHDPAVFDRPEEFDPARKQNARHLAFGYGRHRCIGEHLARLELDIFLEEFLRRIPDYRLVPGTRIEMKHATVRGPKRFEICWDPR